MQWQFRFSTLEGQTFRGIDKTWREPLCSCTYTNLAFCSSLRGERRCGSRRKPTNQRGAFLHARSTRRVCEVHISNGFRKARDEGLPRRRRWRQRWRQGVCVLRPSSDKLCRSRREAVSARAGQHTPVWDGTRTAPGAHDKEEGKKRHHAPHKIKMKNQAVGWGFWTNFYENVFFCQSACLLGSSVPSPPPPLPFLGLEHGWWRSQICS